MFFWNYLAFSVIQWMLSESRDQKSVGSAALLCCYNLCRPYRWGNLHYRDAAAAESLQSCLTLCEPIDSLPPGSPVSGVLQARTLEWLPFPSPMHESEKWKWSPSVVSDSSRPHGLQPTRLLCPWDFPGKSTGVGCHCLVLCYYFFLW